MALVAVVLLGVPGSSNSSTSTRFFFFLFSTYSERRTYIDTSIHRYINTHIHPSNSNQPYLPTYRYSSSSGGEVYSPDGSASWGHRGDCGWRNPYYTTIELADKSNADKSCVRYKKGRCIKYSGGGGGDAPE